MRPVQVLSRRALLGQGGPKKGCLLQGPSRPAEQQQHGAAPKGYTCECPTDGRRALISASLWGLQWHSLWNSHGRPAKTCSRIKSSLLVPAIAPQTTPRAKWTCQMAVASLSRPACHTRRLPMPPVCHRQPLDTDLCRHVRGKVDMLNGCEHVLVRAVVPNHQHKVGRVIGLDQSLQDPVYCVALGHVLPGAQGQLEPAAACKARWWGAYRALLAELLSMGQQSKQSQVMGSSGTAVHTEGAAIKQASWSLFLQGALSRCRGPWAA